MNVLHSIDMAVLFLGFGSRFCFYRTIERPIKRPKPMNIPLLIWIIPAMMVVFVYPINGRVDAAMYAIAAPLMFWNALKWRDTIQDYRILRQAGVTYPETHPYLLRWRNGVPWSS
jgi:hypothetical protein